MSDRAMENDRDDAYSKNEMIQLRKAGDFVMQKDYHIHPFILYRPEKFDDFMQQAIALGFEEVCITDHMPAPGMTSPDRIPMGCVAQYAAAVREQAERYRGKLSIKCGIEIDHSLHLEDVIKSNLAQASFDCILGSTHPNMLSPRPESVVATRSDFAAAILRNALDAARSGRYHILTHIDLYRRMFARAEELKFSLPADDFHPRQQEKLLREIFHVVREQGMRLEMNASLNPKNRAVDEVHPDPWIMLLAQDMGVDFSYGSDSHTPKEVGMLYEELKCTPPYHAAIQNWEEVEGWPHV